MSDLMRFMRQEEATKAMNLFEGAQEHNRVSKRSLKNWVVINLSLHLAKLSYNELWDDFLNVVLWILM